ncbi:NAD-dependent epimerase/dehydratase family protein [Allonocardiopsis opalescens]|uniref:Nucleoside-diphosphate-sugar epimerase n=1 Tax=Allonocardiopsis opalescens TaxID=1144618 RepID=A0A2T0Q493_9ACTN|nr:NAD-dependent epimerase/dehydratase family protein [Allonocardiopsis opalescens]PRX98600.1 nucleoside-diphosphate-sugar epimerase [Allonocardiopsis opalescens]
MRVVVIGGTQFIGRRVAAELLARGDEVLVVHRGGHEPPELAACRHLHVDRREFDTVADEVAAFAPDAVVDTVAMSGIDAATSLPHLPDVPVVVLSSADVYQAFDVMRGAAPEPVAVPLTEDAELRRTRYPHRGAGFAIGDYDFDSYEKLDVEPAYLERGGTVLRLGFVYGEHDYQRREEPVLRRVRAGRERIPVGPGDWLASRVYVGDVAGAVLAALGNPAAHGEVFNIAEPTSLPVVAWVRQILAAAGHRAELVRVPESRVPADLVLTGSSVQHVLLDSRKAMDLLGWSPGPVEESIGRSVRWHLANPPESADPDFSADDKALAKAAARSGAGRPVEAENVSR